MKHTQAYILVVAFVALTGLLFLSTLERYKYTGFLTATECQTREGITDLTNLQARLNELTQILGTADNPGGTLEQLVAKYNTETTELTDVEDTKRHWLKLALGDKTATPPKQGILDGIRSRLNTERNQKQAQLDAYNACLQETAELQVLDIIPSIASPPRDTDITVAFQLKNTGSAAFTGSISVRLFKDAVQEGATTTQTVNLGKSTEANAETQITLPQKIRFGTAGVHKIKVEVTATIEGTVKTATKEEDITVQNIVPYVADAFLTAEGAHNPIDQPNEAVTRCATEAGTRGLSGTFLPQGTLADCGGGTNSCNGEQILCVKKATQTDQPVVEVQLLPVESNPQHLSGSQFGCPQDYFERGTLADCRGTSGNCVNGFGNQKLCIKKATGITKVLDIKLTPTSNPTELPDCEIGYTQAGGLADCGGASCQGLQRVCVKKDGPSLMLGSRRLLDGQGGDPLNCASDEVVCGARGSGEEVNALDMIFCCKKHGFNMLTTQPNPSINDMDRGGSNELMPCDPNQAVCGAKNHPNDPTMLDNIDCCQTDIIVQSPQTATKELDTAGQTDVFCDEDEAVCAGRTSSGDRIDHIICCKLSKPTTKTLTVTVSGTGNGKVDSSPAGITDCRKTGGTCSSPFAISPPTTVELTATPDTNNEFGGFTGCTLVTGNSLKCTITLDSEHVGITAGFVTK